MSYLVLARKWRPQTFDDVVGQQATTRALTSALASGRVAHAFLFTGARGVGKTTAARILAKALNCERGPGPTPCNECALCEEITSGRAVDVLEIDGASNTGVDDVRELREKVKYLPSRTRYKVIIIDEVHMLSGSAFNALLKTLEEPPPHVVFVFATTEPHKIPATVLSRVQRYDFRRIPYSLIVERLSAICRAENVEAPDGALALIAREAEGSMRDALSLLDQAWSSAAGGALREEEVADALGVVDRSTLFALGRALLGRDPRACLEQVDQVFVRGYDIRQFSTALLGFLRDLAVARVSPDAAFFDRPDHEVAQLREMVSDHEAASIYRLFDTLARAFDEIARAPYPKLLLEMTLLKMATFEPLEPLGDAIARLEEIESRLGGAPEPPRGGAAGGRDPSPAPPPTSGGPAGPGAGASPASSLSSPASAEAPSRPSPAVPAAASPAPAPPAPAPPAPAPPAAAPPAPAPPAAAPPAAAPPAAAPPAPAPPAAEAGPRAAEGSIPAVATDQVPGDSFSRWSAIVEKVRGVRPGLAAVVEQGRPLACDPQQVRIAFTEPFSLDRARDGDSVDVLVRACREVLGAEVRLSLEAFEGSAEAAPPSLAEQARQDEGQRQAEERRGLEEHPHVRSAQELLGARLLEVRLDGPREPGGDSTRRGS